MTKRELPDSLSGWIPEGRAVGITTALLLGLYIVYRLIFSDIPVTALGFAALPLAVILFLLIVKFYHRIFYLLFISHFLFLLISSFVEMKIGVATLSFNVAITVLIIIASVYNKTSWKESRNGMLFLFSIWGAYCILELANPNTVQSAWNIAITNHFVYPVLCAILVPLSLRRYRNIEWLLFIWSAFIILAAFKGYWQESHGFNAKEMVFLFEKGGAKTHIIWSGIRYFSFFTDAANYGVHMAMGALGFGAFAYFTKSKWQRVYFSIVALLAIYGMMISGTRTAIAVPIGGLMFFTLMSRSWKTFTVGLFALFAIFFFFSGTTIGESNQYIRKMRSAFAPERDASYNVRIQNRELIKEYMVDKPFGYGLGLSSGRSIEYGAKEAVPFPPDSWLVNVWIETGIVGAILYIILHIILFAWCSWILMFKLTNKRLRNLLAVWLCINAGFFIATYANDVMQYPNTIIVYTGFALCFAGPAIEAKEKQNDMKNPRILK